MIQVLRKVLPILIATAGWLTLSSWTGGPAPECSKDSLAIVRVVKPINELFDVKPVLYISKGKGGIDLVEVNDGSNANGDGVLKQTLTDFLSNGYTIQSATETVDSGVKLNTYYLKKKVI
jgi:hypothetical protein